MKRRWQNQRKAAGKDYSKPNIIMNSAVQVCWEKAARYFEVEERYVFCTEDRFVADPKEVVELVDGMSWSTPKSERADSRPKQRIPSGSV